MCVEIVHYHALVNKEKVGLIFLGSGLKQGDPLSPYLFILGMEGLSKLLKKVKARGEVHEI
uniref:Reverse transcriptase domain-containing protein n=1 Tax=Cajanus cajan TaxID=3821 RepID=A0A151SJ40_CAJCA|nr:hypothetical protein KK1_000974 [Cajanus cajan]